VRVRAAALGRKARQTAEAYLAHRLDAPLGPAARAFGQALARISGGLASDG